MEKRSYGKLVLKIMFPKVSKKKFSAFISIFRSIILNELYQGYKEVKTPTVKFQKV